MGDFGISFTGLLCCVNLPLTEGTLINEAFGDQLCI